MKIAIIGGKLQGVEVAYLAGKAGYQTLLIDGREAPLARPLCQEFFCCDILAEDQRTLLVNALCSVDLVIPALENQPVLDALVQLSREQNLKLAFDPHAYSISSSKLKSDHLFHQNQIPSPRYYPDAKPPCIAKPSGASGSQGVRLLSTQDELEDFVASIGSDPSGNSELPLDPRNYGWIIQEYLTGPSYSIEVIGRPSCYNTYAVTEIHMDEVYDCRMVISPCPITQAQEEGFSELAVKLAELVALEGIMDVEVIDHLGTFQVLEIDARFPSQTPIVVYHSTGRNLVEELAAVTCGDSGPEQKTAQADAQARFGVQSRFASQARFASLEHLLIQQDPGSQEWTVTEHGEHIMGMGGPLTLRKDFFGSDEVLTDYEESENNQQCSRRWRGTFINWADTQEALDEKRHTMRSKLKQGLDSGKGQIK